MTCADPPFGACYDVWPSISSGAPDGHYERVLPMLVEPAR
jgi:hypothetical protein